jgi:chemotaxis protein methyltransferase WspC
MLDRLETLLKTLIGLDIESIGRGAVERALRGRLAACRVEQAAYLGLLEQSAAERQALIEAVVVPETWFFRYPEAFALLAERAMALRAARGPVPLRILSLPCSTGEEPYSIAMCLLDAGFAPAELRIDAVDVSRRALDAATAARYGANSFRAADLSFRDRHFRAEAGGHVLGDTVRATVSLRAGNLLDASFMPGPASYDFVFCRNLLIYFDRATQLQALARLEAWLAPEGLLFVGPAEAGTIRQQGLQALDWAQSFAFTHRSAAAAPAPPPAPLPAWPPTTRPLPAARPQPRVAARPAQPAPTPPAMPNAAALAGLAQIERLADAGQVADALAACAQQLQRFGPSAALFYWWGLLCDGERRSADAESYYRKALYLEPRHAEALAHLAALLAARGDRAGAQRLQQRLKQQGERRAGA